ncbi:FMN-dependent NADH-azoreductase [Gilvimarinus agarilyticus]|uniref:FMN-dependent NADH-azoreductase n=1 Tax=Gilvimarinus agarilyticus TaxID=679259 RepID=UPI00059F2CA0|nr:NAD(P)H-dependent oxidoreductase [Gilvimarinus agarilyticus]
MANLLILHASGRINRSVTRALTAQFRDQWQVRFPGGCITERDLVAEPCSFVNEPWIAAAFTDPAHRTADMQQALALSDVLIDELMAADHVVIGAPLYNFGLPAALKAYIDQIVRVGRTFTFDAEQENPYTPQLPGTPLTVITSAGDGALLPGGELYELNCLEPNLKTLASFIGLAEPVFIRVGYEEYQDGRHLSSKARAARELADYVARLGADETAVVGEAS